MAGLLPLSFSLSPRQLRLLTALGTGVLVGTSLIVIIPEGVDTLYQASGNSHNHEGRSLQSVLPQRNAVLETHRYEDWKRFATPQDSSYIDGSLQSGPDDGFNIVNLDALSANPGENEGSHTDREPHAWVGVSLISGFILMYLIDTLPRHARKHSQPQRFPVSLNQFSFNNLRGTSTEESPTSPDDTATSSDNNGSRPSSTTVGLVIHAAADGIALGASSTTSSNLSFVIFIALLIHKHVPPEIFWPSPSPLANGDLRSNFEMVVLTIMQGASGFRSHIRASQARLVNSGSEDAPDHLLACSSDRRTSYLVCHSHPWPFKCNHW